MKPWEPGYAVSFEQQAVSNALGDCVTEIHRLQADLAACKKDAERLEWIDTLFVGKWNGVVGAGCKYNWMLIGDYRHRIEKMQGKTLRDAIDEALEEQSK